MAKNDDDLVKKYAAETRGMPPNLAKIAARNLARTDAQIGRTTAIRNRIEGSDQLPPDVIASRYGGGASTIPQGAQPGYYGGKGEFLGTIAGGAPKGATGLVGINTPPALPPLPKPAAPRQERVLPTESAFPTLTGLGELSGILQPRTRTVYPGVVSPAASFGEQVGSFLGRIGRAGLGGLTSPFFPAVRSFLDQFSTRPRPYSPQPVPISGAQPSPTPGPRTASNNPYYDFNP